MSKNINNDVSKDPPIAVKVAALYKQIKHAHTKLTQALKTPPTF